MFQVVGAVWWRGIVAESTRYRRFDVAATSDATIHPGSALLLLLLQLLNWVIAGSAVSSFQHPVPNSPRDRPRVKKKNEFSSSVGYEAACATNVNKNRSRGKKSLVYTT
jgi:hypothetical protein